jgi:cardiolipin synthase
VGTTNFDSRSFAHNEENNVCFCDRTLASELEETFFVDMGGCDAVSYKAWRQRPTLDKIVQAVVSLLQEQV